jgi:hypothetical protein
VDLDVKVKNSSSTGEVLTARISEQPSKHLRYRLAQGKMTSVVPIY